MCLDAGSPASKGTNAWALGGRSADKAAAPLWSAHPEVEDEEQHSSGTGVHNVVPALGTVHDLLVRWMVCCRQQKTHLRKKSNPCLPSSPTPCEFICHTLVPV